MQKTAPSVRTLVFFLPYVIIGVVHLVALFCADSTLATFTKPLLMPLLLVGFLFALPRWRSEVALLGGLGILFSWLGDTSLLNSSEIGFLMGLGFFLLAHVAYLVLFLHRLRMRRLRVSAAVYAVWWVALLIVLAPSIGNLLGPVAVYGLVLGAMAAVALSGNAWLALGGALFVVSDSLLGLHKFMPGFEPWQVDFLVMLSYIAAQALIALGVVHWAWGQSRSATADDAPADLLETA